MYEIKKILGKNVKRLRAKKKLTQEALAEASDLQPQMIRNLESALNFVSADSLANITEALKVNPMHLFSPFDEISTKDGDVLKEDIIRILNGCSDKRLKLIHQFVYMISSNDIEN